MSAVSILQLHQRAGGDGAAAAEAVVAAAVAHIVQVPAHQDSSGLTLRSDGAGMAFVI